MELIPKDRRKLRWLQETVSTMILDNGNEVECIKDRIEYYKEHKLDKSAYEMINVESIPDDIDKKKNEYYGKHIWVVVNLTQ